MRTHLFISAWAACAAALGACASEARYYEMAVAEGYTLTPEPVIGLEECLRISEAAGDRYNGMANRDTDGNGRVSREEWKRAITGWSFRFDRNGDGAISWPEYALAVCPYPQDGPAMYEGCYRLYLGRFRSVEESGDGLVTRAEFQQIADFGYSRARTCIETLWCL